MTSFLQVDSDKFLVITNKNKITIKDEKIIAQSDICNFDCEIINDEITISYVYKTKTYYVVIEKELLVPKICTIKPKITIKQYNESFSMYLGTMCAVMDTYHEHKDYVNFISGCGFNFKQIDATNKTIQQYITEKKINELKNKIDTFGVLLKSVIQGKYLTISHGQIEFKNSNEIIQGDSFKFYIDSYKTTEILIIHNNEIGCLSRNKKIITYNNNQQSVKPIFIDYKQHAVFVSSKGKPLNFINGVQAVFDIIHFDRHMDANFEFGEIPNTEPFALQLDETDQYLTFNDGGFGNEKGLSYRTAGKLTLYDIKFFRIIDNKNEIKIIPYPIINYSNPTYADETGEDNPQSLVMLDRLRKEHTNGYLFVDSNGNLNYDKNPTLPPNVGIKQVGKNKIMLYDTRDNHELSKILQKTNKIDYCIEINTKIEEKEIEENDHKYHAVKKSDVINKMEPIKDRQGNVISQEKFETEFKKMIASNGMKLKSKYGYLTISNNQVTLKEHPDGDDSFVFMINQWTCTMIQLMTVHKENVGAIFAFDDQLEFINNIDTGCNMFMRSEEDKYYLYVYFDNQNLNEDESEHKYLVFSNKKGLKISRGRPIEFKIEPN